MLYFFFAFKKKAFNRSIIKNKLSKEIGENATTEPSKRVIKKIVIIKRMAIFAVYLILFVIFFLARMFISIDKQHFHISQNSTNSSTHIISFDSN